MLLRENYYSIINGYKDPFLDKDAMKSSADDVYMEGTRFERLYSLFEFDRELRQITFSYLIQAEAALKTATVYAFCESHRACSDYLNRSSFCSARDMLKLLEVALPGDIVTGMRKDVGDLLRKYDGSLHEITTRDFRKQLGV